MRTKHRDGRPPRIIVEMGADTGIRVASLAHEAHHAATWVMMGNWAEWAPRWAIRAQKEETHAYVVERITQTGMSVIAARGLHIDNTHRHVSSWLWTAKKI